MHDRETRPKLYRGVSHLRRWPILLSIFLAPTDRANLFRAPGTGDPYDL